MLDQVSLKPLDVSCDSAIVYLNKNRDTNLQSCESFGCVQRLLATIMFSQHDNITVIMSIIVINS